MKNKQSFIIRKFSTSRIEWNYISRLLAAIDDENIRNYVTNQIEWHAVKAYEYRFLDYSFKILTIFMPALVAWVQQIRSDLNEFAQILALVTATITSATGVFSKWHDKRLLYRKTVELLKEETILYISNTGKYKNQRRDEIFVLEIHEIVSNANKDWGKLESKEENKETRDMMNGKGTI